jgi:hypothetical protein
MTMATPNAPAFVGWHKAVRQGTWYRVSEGASWDEAMVALLAADLPSGSMVVLAAGRHPDDPIGGRRPSQKPATRRPAPRDQRHQTKPQRNLFT